MSDTLHPAEALLQAGVLPMAPGPYFGRYVLAGQKDTPERAAEKMRLPVDDLVAFIDDKLSIDSRLADRLAEYARTSPRFWLSMQDSWDYTKAKLTPAEMNAYWRVDTPTLSAATYARERPASR